MMNNEEDETDSAAAEGIKGYAQPRLVRLLSLILLFLQEELEGERG